MSEVYRPDIGQVYRKYRSNVAPFYPSWFSGYEGIARNRNLKVSGGHNIAYELEEQSLREVKDNPSHGPLKMVILMGPLCSGKSLIKDYLKRAGLPTVRDYITRPPRPNEVDDDEYEFILDDELSKLHEEGSLAYINEHAYAEGEQPYRSGFPKKPFLDLIQGQRPFFVTKTYGGWKKLEDFLDLNSYDQFRENKTVNIFLLPPAPHILVLRAIQRTLQNFQIPNRGMLNANAEERLEVEFRRSIARPNVLEESSGLRKVVYLVNDHPDRVISKISSLI